MATSIAIRPATPADLPAIGRLGALLIRMHHELDPARFLAAASPTEAGYAAFLGKQLAIADVVLLVAEQDGEVVGYTYARVEGTDWDSLRGPAGIVHDIMIDPALRGQGVGRMLLDATLSALASRGAPRVLLSAAERNDAAQHFFERAGFRRTMVEMTREVDGERE